LRIGILGTAHAVDYASSISGLADCKLVGLFSPDTRRGTAFARAARARFFKSAEKLLEAADCVVLSVREKRLEFIERAAAAGVHILCEMPLAPDIREAKRIPNICQKKNVRLMPALHLRFSTVLRKAKEAISAGKVNNIVSVISRYRVPESEPLSSGVILQEGAHIFDLLRWILRSEFTEIYAQTPSNSRGQFSIISARLKNGVIISTDLCGFPPDACSISNRSLRIKFVGRGGTVEADAFGQTITVCGKEALRRIEWGDNTYRGMVESFVRSIERGDDFEVSANDGLIATEVAVIASRAASKGAPVTVS
jgi:predicted dehydrogenase